MSSVRIDLRRLSLIYGATIVVPLAIGFLAELFIDAAFSLVLTAAFASIPLGVFFVCRTALAEMERVVQLVAPVEEPACAEAVLEDSRHLSKTLPST